MAIPSGPDLEYVRGDTAPLTINVTQDGAAFNWGGYTDIEITVNPEKSPADNTGQIAQFAGTPRDLAGADGRVDFVPADLPTSEAFPPGNYFYDFAAVDGSGRKATFFLGGKFKILQDINKD